MFSEWSNDVSHYAFDITETADLNRLIEKLASIKSELRQIRLSPTAEPRGLGWVTSLPEGNKIAALFSIGDQEQVNQWYRGFPGAKFGVMTFTDVPVAVPPTLTIYVANEKVDLDKLEIPNGVEVVVGDCPRVYHKWNTDIEAERTK